MQRLREGIKRRKMSREPCLVPQINFRKPVDCSGGVLPFMPVSHFPERLSQTRASKEPIILDIDDCTETLEHEKVRT